MRKLRLSEIKEEAKRLNKIGKTNEAKELWSQAVYQVYSGNTIIDDSIPKNKKTQPLKFIG